MFVPGNKQRFIDKTVTIDVDAIFLDLEDGVPPSEKAAARFLVAEALRRPPGGPKRYVRVNAVSSPWFQEDLKEVLVVGLDGICIPKVETPEEIGIVGSLLDASEVNAEVRVVAAIESARGLVNAPAIAASHSRLAGLMMGTEDYALDIGLGTQREREAREMLYARSALVVAAASAHILSIDGVFPNLDDEEGLLADVLQARRLGFSAKSTFNPRQVTVINQVFNPSEDEVDYARKVVSAFHEALKRGDGSVAVGGQLVDSPIVQRAERLLATLDQHRDVGEAGPD